MGMYIHYDYLPWNDPNHINGPGHESDIGVDYSQDFHKYAVEWSPIRTIWYFDDQVVWQAFTHVEDAVHVIFNLGVMKYETGTDPPVPFIIPSSTPFPAKMYIDYFHYYTLRRDCNAIINTCTYDLPNHDNELKNQITIGGDGCENVAGANTYLRASDFISFPSGLTVPLGSTFFATTGDDYCDNPILPTYTNPSCGYIYNPCNIDFGSYNNTVKKEIILGGNSCVSEVLTNTSIDFRATDKITLLPGFSTQTGSNATLEIIPCQ